MTIRSMTGYGSAKGSCAGWNIGVEIKSVNNRYLDCSVRLPRGVLFAEEEIKRRVQAHIARGKVDVFVTLESDGTDTVAVRVNEPLARGYAEAVRSVSEKLGLEDSLTAYALCRLPDVLTVEKPELDAEALTAALARRGAGARVVRRDAAARGQKSARHRRRSRRWSAASPRWSSARRDGRTIP